MDIQEAEQIGSTRDYVRILRSRDIENNSPGAAYDTVIDHSRLAPPKGGHQGRSGNSVVSRNLVNASGRFASRSSGDIDNGAGNSKLAGFILELERRGVLRVGAGYLVACWLAAQVAELIAEIFLAPTWMLRALLIALAIGFPIALIVAWAFELTTSGFKWDSEVRSSESIVRKNNHTLDFAIIAILVVMVSALLVTRDSMLCGDPLQMSSLYSIPSLESENALYY